MKKTAVAALSCTVLFAGSAMTASADEISAEDVLNHANEAMAGLDSYSSLMEAHQVISDEMMGDFESHTTAEQDIIMNPFKLREVMNISVDGEEFTITTYWTEEGIYIGDEEGWIKMEDEGLHEIMFDPESQLGDLYGHHEELSLTEEDGYYVLTYDGDGEELMHLFEMGGNGNGYNGEDEMLDDMMGDFMEDVEISHFWYELHVDAETHYVTGIEMEMDMEFHFEGETQTIEQWIDISYHNFNSVEDFDVPAEVKEQAQHIDELAEELIEEAEEGDEMAATATSTPLMALAGLLTAAGAAAVLATRRRFSKV
ncbi:DUF6612 family protein [Alteribacter lacisalsi]